MYHSAINPANFDNQTDWDGLGRTCIKLGLNESLFNPNSKLNISYYRKCYDILNTLSFKFFYTQDTFITSNIPIAVYPTSKAKKVAIWLPLSSHIGIIFSGNKKHKRNNLVDSTNKTETLNFLVANNANLYYQKTALLIGNNKRCLTKAYDIVSSPNFGLSDL